MFEVRARSADTPGGSISDGWSVAGAMVVAAVDDSWSVRAR